MHQHSNSTKSPLVLTLSLSPSLKSSLSHKLGPGSAGADRHVWVPGRRHRSVDRAVQAAADGGERNSQPS